jgi:hypothetical protein
MDANGLPFDDSVTSGYSHLGEAIFLTTGGSYISVDSWKQRQQSSSLTFFDNLRVSQG